MTQCCFTNNTVSNPTTYSTMKQIPQIIHRSNWPRARLCPRRFLRSIHYIYVIVLCKVQTFALKFFTLIFTLLLNFDIGATKNTTIFLILCPLKHLLKWRGTTPENMSEKNPRASRRPQHAYVGGSTPPAVLNENSLPVSSIGCVIIYLWYVCG